MIPPPYLRTQLAAGGSHTPGSFATRAAAAPAVSALGAPELETPCGRRDARSSFVRTPGDVDLEQRERDGEGFARRRLSI